jgi:hypothetical protein
MKYSARQLLRLPHTQLTRLAMAAHSYEGIFKPIWHAYDVQMCRECKAPRPHHRPQHNATQRRLVRRESRSVAAQDTF